MAVGKGNANFCRKKYVSETGNGVILRGWMTAVILGKDVYEVLWCGVSAK